MWVENPVSEGQEAAGSIMEAAKQISRKGAKTQRFRQEAMRAEYSETKIRTRCERLFHPSY
jgi:hypothetical protein